MEQDEIDVAKVVRSILQKSEDYVRKQHPKPSSVKFYCRLLSHYDVHLACDICICIDESTHKCGLNTVVHKCSQNQLVLFAKKTAKDGDLLRMRPGGYSPLTTDCICEFVDRHEVCLEKHLCPYPHTDVERDLWKQDYSDAVNIASLVYDLRESSLLVSVIIDHLLKKFSGTFKLVCATCYEESREVNVKRRHVPECKSLKGHHWGKKKLMFENASDRQLIDFDTVDTHDEEHELVSSIIELLSNVTVDDIAAESARLTQAYRSASKSTDEGEQALYNLESDDSDTENEPTYLAKTDKEIFDKDATDVLNIFAFDDDTGDNKDKTSARSRVRGNYYKMWSEEQTEDDLHVVYRCGKITLRGPFAGRCMIDDGELREQNGCEVELRGRVNCGPAFDGDIVRVKVYKKDKNKLSKAGNVESGNSSQLYGTVVEVVKRNIHRTARTFVCTVGRYGGNLMTPLCGTAPKFHIIDTCLLKRYGPKKKDNYVAVYDSKYDNILTLRKTVKLDPCNRKKMLFVVKYLKWENKHKYPLGYVCRILHASCTNEDSQKMLDLMYVQLPFNEDTELEVTAEESEEQKGDVEDTELEVTAEESEEQEGDLKLPVDKREDLCALLTVSIDPPGTKDVDDALSLEESDGKFVVWIHVADVTHYIQKDDMRDVEAQRYLLSFHSSFPRQVLHMLPKKEVEQKYSLLENRRRRAMSVRFELTAKGKVLSSATKGPSPSWIRNNKQLSHEDVQGIIDGYGDIDQDIEQMLIHLHNLATKLRKRRMRDGSHYYEYNREQGVSHTGIADPFDIDQNHDAQRIVEEFMFVTNQHVGQMLRQKFPDCTPFRVQNAPKDKLLESWKRSHGCIVPFSFYFNQFQQHQNAGIAEQLFMLSNCWDAINAAVDLDDVRKVRTIIGSEQLHPLHSIALSTWFDIQEPWRYTCCVDNEISDTTHFSLQTRDYVHFTSPLRRYVDIIAHRLVKADPHQPAPYTYEEVMALCEKMNERKSLQRLHDRHCALLKVASMLQTPIYIPCYVENVNDFSIHLASPYFQTDSPDACRLKFSEMTVSDNPVPCGDSGGKVTLNWSKRYYDTRKSRATNARSDSVTDYVLDSNMFGTTVRPRVWKSMHKAVKGPTEELLARVSCAVQENRLKQHQQQPHDTVVTVQEVTSEMAENKPLVRHHVKFSRDIERGTVLPVQFGARAVKGCLQPVIKLVNLTDEKDICIEHQRDPVDTFASVATKKAKKGTYMSLWEYQIIWQAILKMEAATNAVRNESIVCSHVPVRFIQRNGQIYGTLQLDKEFCDERYISIYRVSEEETHDYMCIRYFLKETRRVKCFGRNVWVAHAGVVSCSRAKGVIELTVKCNCMDSEAPSELFSCTNRYTECTVEFLQRALPDK